MKIFESLATYHLSVILTYEEELLYRNAFRSQEPIQIPELENKFYRIQSMNIYYDYFELGQDKQFGLILQEVLPKDHAIKRDTLLKSWGVDIIHK